MNQATLESWVGCRFDSLVNQFPRHVAESDPQFTALVQALGPFQGKTLLDVGCGKGRFAIRLLEQGADVVGLDRSRAMLEQASAHFPRVHGSAGRLPFASQSFHAAFAIEVWQHLPQLIRPAFLGEIQRVLRPGGLLILIDRNLHALNPQRPWLPELLRKWIDQTRGRWMYRFGEPVQERWNSLHGLSRQLEKWFPRVECHTFLSADEQGRALFESCAWVRRMAIWRAWTPGGAS
jgi:2-polyprenyl-6-hydroxyphenyl methylase/3-demethylubiquinone-9 3-methyltransferase